MHMKNIHFSKTMLTDGFWHHYKCLNRDVTIPSVYRHFYSTGRFDAFRCDWKEGMPNKPHFYWDSDVAKWIEAVAYQLQEKKDPELERIVDETVELIIKNQEPSGYFNIYHMIIEPENKFRIRDHHELYCAGHLLEAAIAYDQATGKDAFLKAMIRYMDHIYQVFTVDQSAAFVTPGHEEIELALIKLYDHTGIQKYLELAAFFVEERGRNPEKDVEKELPHYKQTDVPVRAIQEAKGHAVRACYLYTAMAMLAKRKDDQQLLDVCRNVLNDILTRKMTVTGGIGANIQGEAFGKAYMLTNDRNYNETCAAISLTMFAGELQETAADTTYGDVIERVLYNGMLSGLSLSGDAFFYENALEIDLRDYDYSDLYFSANNIHEIHHRGLLSPRRLERAKVFECSCCPPNINRLLASLPRYSYTQDGNTIYCNQFMAGRTELNVDGNPAVLELKTDYPVSGKLSYTYHGAPAVLAVRIPDWCVEYTGGTQNGFAHFPVTDGQTITVELPMELHFVSADPRIRSCAGKFAVTRGPLVYCLEAVDNGTNLWDLELLDNGNYTVQMDEDFPAPVIWMDAHHRVHGVRLYNLRNAARESLRVRLIPYFCFANRGNSDMQVWTMVK